VRGRLHPLPTASAYYRGRLDLACEFEEFNEDTPLNRVLKAAARRVTGSPALERTNRRRALAAANRMELVGELRFGDLVAPLTRTTAYYRDALTLARHVLRSEGRAPAHGVQLAWTFLIRTPEMVEEGIRRILAEGHRHRASVEKRGCQIVGTKMTLNPDLVFNKGDAVADVKYKLSSAEWRRGDLYQIVAFAEGFHTPHAAVLGFCAPDAQTPPSVSVGDVHVSHLSWPANSQLSPKHAAYNLVAAVDQWLKEASLPLQLTG
jgi:5-methylcytosine-specific restriction endonuclease McrBC regulatory subunit McrC